MLVVEGDDDTDHVRWRVNMVTVPAGYAANSLTSAEAIRASGYGVRETDMVVNCPVVSVA